MPEPAFGTASIGLQQAAVQVPKVALEEDIPTRTTDREGDAEWAQIDVEDVFAEALSLSWPGLEREHVRVRSYSLEVQLAAQATCAPAGASWSVTGLIQTQAHVSQLPEDSAVELRVVAYLGGRGAGRTRHGPWQEVKTFKLDYTVGKINLDPRGCARGPCVEGHCPGFISTEAQDPQAVPDSLPLCARCGLMFDRHSVLNTGAEALAAPTAALAAAAPREAVPFALPPGEVAPVVLYCIVGTWTNWVPRDMLWNVGSQYYECSVEIGAGGQENFQLLLGGNWSQRVYPDRKNASPLVPYSFCGPNADEIGNDLNWTIGMLPHEKVEEGDRFKIRFFIHDDGEPKHVDWAPLTKQDQLELEKNLQLSPPGLLEESLLEAKLRWGCLTSGLEQAGQPQAAEGLGTRGRQLWDKPSEQLCQLLEPMRERVLKNMKEKLDLYDSAPCLENPQRQFYEMDLLLEGVKEIRTALIRHHNHGCLAPVWKIIGGERTGGLKVRKGIQLTSEKLEPPLGTGALVEELEMVGDRLRYQLIAGKGPQEGWISARVRSKAMAVKHSLSEEMFEAREEARAEGVQADAEEVRRWREFKQEHQRRALKAFRCRQDRCKLMLETVAAEEEDKAMEGTVIQAEAAEQRLVSGDARAKEMPKTPQLPQRHHIPVIIGLMAAHIRTEERLRRFYHVLDSVKKQELEKADAEFLFSLSWSSIPEYEDKVESTVSSFRSEGLVVVRQVARQSQFQHLKAALALAEETLQERWAAQGTAEELRSVWVIFGDDDDIWHRKRVSEYAAAINSHPLLDGVGIFVTTTRANCPRNAQLEDQDLPVDGESINNFLRSGHVVCMEEEESSKRWQMFVQSEGPLKAGMRRVPDELTLEYFDFCPRLRILHEFFSQTTAELLVHRYCDLRFNEFLRLYPLKGLELGLEVSTFFPSCWMLFYATPIVDDQHVKGTVEGGDSTEVQINNGHMSANYSVEPTDNELSTRALNDFKSYDRTITHSRLTRYWAAFRNAVENYSVRHTGDTIDQRYLDFIVSLSLRSSFFAFTDKLNMMSEEAFTAGMRMMQFIGRGYATVLMQRFSINVLWFKPALFFMPVPEDTEAHDSYSAPFLQDYDICEEGLLCAA